MSRPEKPLKETAMRQETAMTVNFIRLLALAIAIFLAGKAAAAVEIKVGGTGNALGTMREVAKAYSTGNPGAKITVLPSLGSGGGINAVANGVIDIAVSSRPLKDEERALDLVESEYARTPFVFAVPAKSTVIAMTSAQIADLYSGRTQAWPEGGRVRLVMRPASDGDSQQIRKMTAAIGEALTHAEAIPGIKFATNDQENAGDIERIPGAFGATTLALITSEDRPLRALALDGVEPTVANAAAGRYPHFTRLYLVTRSKPAADPQRFIAFLRSRQGGDILVRNGNWAP